jgi:hypothetical protein
MTEPLICEVVADRGLVERYVAGRLTDEPDLAAFETHLLTCERCREDVRLGLVVRAELTAPGRQRPHPWTVGLGLALAAGIAAVVLLRGNGDGVRALGAVREPPLYLGVAVRGPGTRSDSMFDIAMTAYNLRDYAAASAGLERTVAAGVDSVPAFFFLGASCLMTGRSAAAAEAFRRVIALGASPYLGEAHYYLAKALLREGNASAALDELRAARVADGAVTAAAAALADTLQGLTKR